MIVHEASFGVCFSCVTSFLQSPQWAAPAGFLAGGFLFLKTEKEMI